MVAATDLFGFVVAGRGVALRTVVASAGSVFRRRVQRLLDPSLCGILRAVQAFGIDAEQHFDAVPGPLGDLQDTRGEFVRRLAESISSVPFEQAVARARDRGAALAGSTADTADADTTDIIVYNDQLHRPAREVRPNSPIQMV